MNKREAMKRLFVSLFLGTILLVENCRYASAYFRSKHHDEEQLSRQLRFGFDKLIGVNTETKSDHIDGVGRDDQSKICCYRAMQHNDVDPRDGFLSKEEFVKFALDLMPDTNNAPRKKMSRPISSYTKQRNHASTRIKSFEDLPMELRSIFPYLACWCDDTDTSLGCCEEPANEERGIRLPVQDPFLNRGSKVTFYFDTICGLTNSAWIRHNQNNLSKQQQQPISSPPSLAPTRKRKHSSKKSSSSSESPSFGKTTTLPPPSPPSPTTSPTVIPTESTIIVTPTHANPSIAPISTTLPPVDPLDMVVREAFVAFSIAIPKVKSAGNNNSSVIIKDAISDLNVAMDELAVSVASDTFGTTTRTTVTNSKTQYLPDGSTLGGGRRRRQLMSKHDYGLDGASFWEDSLQLHEHQNDKIHQKQPLLQNPPPRSDDGHRRRLKIAVHLPTFLGLADLVDCPRGTTDKYVCVNLVFITTLFFEQGQEEGHIDAQVRQFEANLYNAIEEFRLQHMLDKVGVVGDDVSSPSTNIVVGLPSSSEQKEQFSNGKLSAGAVAGIVVAVLTVYAIHVTSIMVALKRRERQLMQQQDDDYSTDSCSTASEADTDCGGSPCVA